MITQIFTFGTGHEQSGCYVSIRAHCREQCREFMFALFKDKWGFQYNSEEEAGVDKYNFKLLMRVDFYGQ